MSEPLSGGRHLLDSLNPQQRRAVTYQGGPLLVLAGAGTGKTRVIVYRLAHLVASRVSPSNLVAVTFTNKAAREMSERAVELLGEEVARDLRVGTFHWLAHRILRRYGSALEIGSGFRLLTPRQSVAALRSTLQDLGYDPKVVSLPAVREAVAARRNEASRLPVTEVDAGLVTQRYSADLRRNRQVDLDGLILECIRLLQTHEHILRKIQGSVGHMLVDEYQDINRPQERLVSLLSGGTGQLTAVGDDDQAIYGWRFADASALRRFSERYRGAEIIRLEKNYRSTRRILRPANALLSHNRMRLGKELFGSGSGGVLPVIHAAGDEGEEARFVVERIRALLREGVPAEEIAVLFRINAESRVLEEALVHAGIGYQIRAGRRFYQRPEVARIIDLLRLALAPEDARSWEPVLARVPGLGSRRMATLMAAAKPLSGNAVETAAAHLLPAAVADRVRELTAGISWLTEAAHPRRQVETAGNLLERVMGPEGATTFEIEAAGENVAEFIAVAGRFQEEQRGDLGDLLDSLALSDSAEGESGVQLMTLHAAKGLEFEAVFVVGVEEGLLPHVRSLERDDDLEEERRLLFVGMTRAKRRLYLSYAHGRTIAGMHIASQPSRFIDEMPSQHFKIEGGAAEGMRPRLRTVKQGEPVHHQRWGLGTVARVEGKGRDTMVTIVFRDGTRQRVQLCHAPLRRVAQGADV